ISLLVTPPQAETVALVGEAGQIRLVLRGPGDTQDSATPGITLAQVLGLEDKGNRQAELVKPDAPKSESVGNTLLDLLKNHANKAPAPPTEAVAAASTWKMVLIRGSEIT